MQLPHLPWSPVVKSLFQHPLALLGGLLFCVASLGAPAQSVTFAGTQTTLPTSGLNDPWGVAVDSSGDVFIAGLYNNGVAKLPWTGRPTDRRRSCRPAA